MQDIVIVKSSYSTCSLWSNAQQCAQRKRASTSYESWILVSAFIDIFLPYEAYESSLESHKFRDMSWIHALQINDRKRTTSAQENECLRLLALLSSQLEFTLSNLVLKENLKIKIDVAPILWVIFEVAFTSYFIREKSSKSFRILA